MTTSTRPGPLTKPTRRDGPQFAATGAAGKALALAARPGLTMVGAAAPAIARVAGKRRYRSIERRLARAAWSTLAADARLLGLQNARGGPFVVTPLHESLVDPLLLSHLPLPLAYLARDDIWEWQAFGRILRAGHHLHAATETRAGSRVGTARDLLRGARHLTAEGDSLVVFPQGSILGIEVAFTRGAFWLARALRVPVLPVVITGTHRIWEYPYTPRMRRKQPVTLQVLPPLPADEAYAQRFEIEHEMRAAALASEHGRPRHFVPARDGYWDGYPFDISPDFAALAEDIAAHRSSVVQGSLS